MTAEQRILAWLERADFDGTGCRWSQENIAAACGCSRRTVIRATQKLAAEGRIHSFLERRPGCKWPCRVYRVKHWNPHKRAGVLNVLRSIQERRSASCHTERTATASKGSDRCGKPSTPRCLAVGSTSAVVAKRDFEIRRSRVDQRRRHLHVADLTCLHCTEKDAELERKDDIIKTLQVELNKAMEGEAEWREAAKAAGRATIAAKGQRTKQAKAEARLEQLEQVVAHWRSHRPRTTPEFGDPGTKSFDIIEKALILKEKDPAGPLKACCEAIDGLHIAPWEAYGKRAMSKKTAKHTLRRDLADCLGDELRIEKCRAILRWAKGDGADRAWELSEVAFATYWALTELTVEQIRERGREPVEPVERRFTVDGIVTRADGR